MSTKTDTTNDDDGTAAAQLVLEEAAKLEQSRMSLQDAERATREQLKLAQRELMAIRLDRRLEGLSDRIPPAVLRGGGLRSALVELSAADPIYIELEAASGETEAITAHVVDVILDALGRLPSYGALLGRKELAGPDVEDSSPRAGDRRTPEQRKVDLAHDITDEKAIALQQKYPGSFA